MLNQSISRLRQILVSNLTLDASTNNDDTHELRAHHAPVGVYGEQTESVRPSVLRRRSTRTNTISESSFQRLSRLEHAIQKHTYESFFVAYVGREVIYVSELQYGSSPSYLPFSVDIMGHDLDLVLYAREVEQKTWRLVLRLQVDLCILVPLAKVRHTANRVKFCFDDEEWYDFPHTDEASLTPTKVTAKTESYCFNQVMRLQSSTEFINDALNSMTRLKTELNELLEQADEQMKRLQELDITKVRLAELTNSCKAMKRKTSAERAKVEKLRSSNSLRRSLTETSKLQMQSSRQDLIEAREELAKRKPALDLLASEIRRVQRQVTTTLSQVYPITMTQNAARIRGLKTARNSDYWMQNHEESAALGYIAHFIFLLSHYLAIPLRYPVRPVSSHSCIIDPISVMPTDSDTNGGPPYSIRKDRRFPLFFQRGEADRLQWGVFLLNKNIEQLLQGRGLVCGDLRRSLQNLASLVVWLVSVNEEEDVTLSPHRTRGTLSTIAPAIEITDHEDLIAAQLRSTIKGKGRMTDIAEKDEEHHWKEDLQHIVAIS